MKNSLGLARHASCLLCPLHLLRTLWKPLQFPGISGKLAQLSQRLLHPHDQPWDHRPWFRGLDFDRKATGL